jgi:hypothetical protein
VVEGFRVLTLLYRVDEIPSERRERLVELFKRYRAIASVYYWSKRLGLREGVKQALEHAKELPSYWRKALDEGSPLYAFSKKTKRPMKHALKLPLAEALRLRHRDECPTTGAYIDCEELKLVVRLGNRERLELPIPERALSWLEEKEREVAPLNVHKTVRIQWREDKDPKVLKVQIVLRVERLKPPKPDPREALLCFVDLNSAYGVAIVFATYDGQRVCVHETLKFRPPNQGRRLREAAKRKRAAAHGSKPNVNYALARLTEKFDASGWVKAAAAEIFKKAMKYAKGRSILMNFDVPDSETVKNSYLQRTLLSIRRVAENLANWYGIHVELRCYSSRKCPLCGGELKGFKTTRTRVMHCECGFYEDRDYIPFYHWLKSLKLPLPKYPLRALQKPNVAEIERPGSLNGLAGKPVGVGCNPQACGDELPRRPGARRASSGCNTRGGAVGRSCDGAAVPLGPRGARASPAAAPPCDPPEQVTGAQWGQARGNQLKPARARAPAQGVRGIGDCCPVKEAPL